MNRPRLLDLFSGATRLGRCHLVLVPCGRRARGTLGTESRTRGAGTAGVFDVLLSGRGSACGRDQAHETRRTTRRQSGDPGTADTAASGACPDHRPLFGLWTGFDTRPSSEDSDYEIPSRAGRSRPSDIFPNSTAARLRTACATRTPCHTNDKGAGAASNPRGTETGLSREIDAGCARKCTPPNTGPGAGILPQMGQRTPGRSLNRAPIEYSGSGIVRRTNAG